MITNPCKIPPFKKGKGLFLWTMGDMGFTKVEGVGRHDARVYLRDRDYLVAKKKEGYHVVVIGIGDYLSAASPSDRAALISAKGGFGMYDDHLTRMDNSVMTDTDALVDVLNPLRGDFAGFHRGHHWYPFSNKSPHFPLDNDMVLAKKLKAKYYGLVAFTVLKFANGFTYRILSYHGNGAPDLPGGAINNRFKRHQGFYADMIVAGHDNKRAADCANFLVVEDNGKLRWQEKRSVCSGAYERAYEKDRAVGDYVEEAMMRPAALGAQMTLFEEFQEEMRIRAHV